MKSPVDMADLVKNDEAKFLELMKAHYSLPVKSRLETERKAFEIKEDRSKWTYNDYRNNDPEALRELFENNNEKFERLFNAHYKK